MIEALKNILKSRDLRNKILFVLFILIIFRVAAVIPVPGIDTSRLKSFFEGNQFFGLLNIFSGGAMTNLSVVMLGVAPYITASIIMQLLTLIFPAIKEIYQEGGEAGYRRFNQYSRLLAVPLALLQGYGFLILLQRQSIIETLTPFMIATDIIIITAGTLFLMWLGEIITEQKIGNGVSLIIFAGIVSGLPQITQQLWVNYEPSNIPTYLTFLAVSLIVIAGVVLITEGQRNIPIQYAKRVRGTRVYGGVSTYLPLRVNQGGVIPIIFAISVLLFPGMIGTMLSQTKIGWLNNLAHSLQNFLNNQGLYAGLYFVLVVLFTYFYTAVTFDYKQIAENIQKQGGFIPGLRPGGPTQDFLGYILNRITLTGAVSLGLIAILPLLTTMTTGISGLTLGGTSLLIVVSVALDVFKQIKAQLAMREYERV